MPRIAFGGFLHETNTFAPSKATYDMFVLGSGWPAMCEGEAVFAGVRNVNVSASGFIDAGRAAGWDLVPLLWAAATPSAHVTKDAYERIAGRMLDALNAAGPIDAVYLDLHGAMVCEHLDDGEGEILARVRAAIGPDVPLVASLDLHGNVTRRMVDEADALIAYRTYPHIDMADTGRRSAAYLAKILGGTRHAKAFRQLDFLIPIAWQATLMEPCRSLYRTLAGMEGDTVPTLSFLPGFPAADFPDCGPSVIAYGETQADADRAADDFAAMVAGQESAFSGEVLSPDEGVKRAMAIAEAGATRPVVIADTQDNPGAGGDSDTTGMLRALVANDAKRAAIGLIVDPAAAKATHEAGTGATIRIALGGKSGIEGDAPFEAELVVEALSDGNLVASGPFYGAGNHLRLGPSACLRIGDVRIVVASRKAQMADQEMFRYVGIEPQGAAILVVKSSVHFRADFEPLAETILICAAPGPMPVDPAMLPWKRLRPGVRIAPNGPAFR
ncbi:MAG TPA: M81 family metallopeptidase [Hyphomicrobiales bacterium]|jgi:microcystin degradation protein MlrC